MLNLDEVLSANRARYLEHFKELVARDTHCLGHGIEGGLEKAGQDYLIDLFRQMHATEIRVDPMDEAFIQAGMREHNEGNPGHVFTDRYNVHARFAGSGGPSLMFNGHIDTMPAGDLSRWTSPPHAPELRDGRLYGLGTTDMKGGLMAAIMAVKLLQDAGYELPGDVIISSVCDEEGGGNGSIQAVMQGIKADGVVVCECSSDELILAHMGFVFFRVRIEGLAVHSGGKWKGVSAIDKAIKIIAALNELEHGWLLRYKHPLLPAPNLNVGVIRAERRDQRWPVIVCLKYACTICPNKCHTTRSSMRLWTACSASLLLIHGWQNSPQRWRFTRRAVLLNKVKKILW